MRYLSALVLFLALSVATAQWPTWEYGVLEWSDAEVAAFIWHTGDDRSVVAATAIDFYENLTGTRLTYPSKALVLTLDFIGEQGWQLMVGNVGSLTEDQARFIFMREAAE